ncbi:MAG TPA: UvrD-helicase domain-containing protein [Chryseolinea sp.]|nr:UvrD-helicase domain-containing protein [Chryseolinea sp.]HPM30266.1 UvrD-helicase domain-containing protein [Chryseolinea sp.]
MTKPFNIYRSSAGSGKTRTLAKEYLKLALRYPEYYRFILAMTFTNKSTQEMKDRIIFYLNDFSEGKSEDLSNEILAEYEAEGFPFGAALMKKRSKEVLSLILHHYSQFSISTIDAFFQRIIRSFTRETGLLGNFRLEIDNTLVLEEVIDLLMEELTDNKELRGWVMDFSLDRLEEGQDWDVRSALLNFSNEIFKEEFKAIEDDVLAVTSNRTFFKDFKQQLQLAVNSAKKRIGADAKRLLDEFHAQQLAVSDFYYGTNGSIYVYVTNLSDGKIALPGAWVRKGLDDTDKWAGAKADKKLIRSLAEQGWHAQLTSIVQYIEEHLEAYHSAEQALKNLYSFGLLSDISRTLRKYLSDNNMMLLSDAPRFLNKLMDEQEASFIYEKVGSFYRHFLVDEFQDTSDFQWRNILPLIRNGVSQNYKSLIVGDIKQSIYRWRGGDLNILQEKVKSDVGELMMDTFPLDTNYRSAENLVNFNNAIFSTASKIISSAIGTSFPQQVYEDVAQKNFKFKDKGYIKIDFLSADISIQDVNDETMKFAELSLSRLPAIMEELQEKKVALKDIAFLVRDNKEGQKIAQHFMAFRSSPIAKPNFQYDVVSNESLRLDQASSILVLINALRLIDDESNRIARAHLAYEYQKMWQPNAFPNYHEIFLKSHTVHFEKLVPPSFVQQQQVLSALPLLELVENLIYIFRLGELNLEIAYLQAFQDLILEFSQRERSDLSSFLVWWEDNKHKKSIQVAGGINAAQIITIHKSKGLQFKYVIIPFLDWELNHQGSKSPMLWCKTDEALFKDAGYVPIKYTQALEETYFKEYYQKERQRIYLDNLNLLYVAFTRAEEGLIAHSPVSKTKTLSHVGQLVKQAIEDSESLNSEWTNESNSFQRGEIEVLGMEQKKQTESIVLKKYPVTPWRDRLQVRRQGGDFFTISEKRKKINEGIFLHTLLSRIHVAEDSAHVIHQAIDEGLIRESEKQSIIETVQWIINHPSLHVSFSEGSTLKAEAALLLPDGSEKRIDRLTIKDGHAILIDYKTGIPSKKDEEQIKNYIHILKSMNMNSIKGFLVYVNERKCNEILSA